jgi:NAD(P)-dependent dehydrogenase (short-subunit alcohol dehydrogenase family)
MRPLALVTGGCHRLGAAIAARLAAAGWDLALHGHRHAAPEPALADAIRAAGIEASVIEADFADLATAHGLVARVANERGRAPQLLVNSAAMFGQDRLPDVTADALLAHYAVNCAAPVLLMKGFAAIGADAPPGTRAIVNILDQRIEQPHGDQLAYTLSKIALAGATRIAAREFAPAIRVNAVAPGLTVPTADYDAASLDRLGDLMPLARLPRPDEIADAVLFLAGARSITAQTLFVDGGARLESWRRDFTDL